MTLVLKLTGVQCESHYLSCFYFSTVHQQANCQNQEDAHGQYLEISVIMKRNRMLINEQTNH